MNAQVELLHLVKTFPDATRPALNDITAAIPAGVVTGLVGPDGAGKSTLLRLMAGLLAPTSGEIKINRTGPDAARASDGVASDPREFIGYMPQKFGLYEDL